MYDPTHVGRQVEVRLYIANSVLCYLNIGSTAVMFSRYYISVDIIT